MKDIQIPVEMFVNLINYFYPDEGNAPSGYEADEIRRQIEDKMQKITNRALFTRYKTAPTAAEREQARREYLAERGISQAFISDTEVRYDSGD